jgi:hypothetical protein
MNNNVGQERISEGFRLAKSEWAVSGGAGTKGYVTTTESCLVLNPIHDLRETFWTVGMSEEAIGRIRSMCLSIRPLRNPALIIQGGSDLVS